MNSLLRAKAFVDSHVSQIHVPHPDYYSSWELGEYQEALPELGLRKVVNKNIKGVCTTEYRESSPVVAHSSQFHRGFLVLGEMKTAHRHLSMYSFRDNESVESQQASIESCNP